MKYMTRLRSMCDSLPVYVTRGEGKGLASVFLEEHTLVESDMVHLIARVLAV